MQDRQEDIAKVVASETGKSYKDAYGETGGAIALGLFYASEGQRLYGRTTTSGTPNRYAMTVRQLGSLAIVRQTRQLRMSPGRFSGVAVRKYGGLEIC
jgi:acyl-CoA reductase-like NAD-dependent aldehyde dehydrogenase